MLAQGMPDVPSTVRDHLRHFYPTVAQMPYCAALIAGDFDKERTLCAEVVEVYRAFGTRKAIKELYIGKLLDARRAGKLDQLSCDAIIGVIDDEGETDDHPDHLDMRLQLFSSVGLDTRSRLAPDAMLNGVNSEWLSVVEEADVFTTIAVFAAIEDWYTGISALYEQEYLKRGYTAYEVQTYAEHKGADVWHSATQIDVLERYSGWLDPVVLSAALIRTFRTSVGYDYAKLCWASHKVLDDLIVGRSGQSRREAVAE